MKNVKVVKSDPPESTEILAESVVKISEGMDKLLNNPKGLKRDTVVLLLHDATKIKKSDIKKILDALPRLRGWYCRK